jgi:multiple sugar transport system ATP-binding protein
VGEIVRDHVSNEFLGGVRAVDGVDMTVEEGEFVVLVGPSGTLAMGSIRLPLDRERRPASGGDRVIAGIRPEAFEDSSFAARDLPQLEVEVEVLESIGSDAYVFFRVDADPVIVEDALSDDEDEDGSLLADESARALFAARVDARTKAQVGGRITLAIDPSRVYYFSPETGESLLGRPLAGAAAT